MNKQQTIGKSIIATVLSMAVISTGLITGCGGTGSDALSPEPQTPSSGSAGLGGQEAAPAAGEQAKRAVAWVEDGLGTAEADSDESGTRRASTAGFYMYFNDNIDSQASNWRVSNGGGSGRFVVGSQYYANASYSVYMKPYGNYENDFERSLNIPVWPADPGGVLHLQFSTRHGLEHSYDKVYVQISSNGGASYSTVKTLTGRNGHWPSWTKWTIQIPGNYSYDIKNYRVRFLMQSDGSVVDWGFAFDKVKVYEANGFYNY